MAFRLLAAAVVLLLWAVPAAAQQSVSLQFQDGRVTLRVQNAPVRAILAEWARLGGATIVNGERVAGPPVTLELTGVPERQALDVVLRSVAGYMLAPRRAGAAGASAFDRIMILPTSVAPRNPPPPATAATAPRPGVLPRPGVIARPPAAALVEPPADSNPVEDGPDEANAQPTPAEPRVIPQPLVRPPVAAGVELSDTDDQTPTGAPQRGVAPTPTNPFGIPFGSSATPGVISPAPKPQPPTPNRVQ
jgi:hypothetical protein